MTKSKHNLLAFCVVCVVLLSGLVIQMATEEEPLNLTSSEQLSAFQSEIDFTLSDELVAISENDLYRSYLDCDPKNMKKIKISGSGVSTEKVVYHDRDSKDALLCLQYLKENGHFSNYAPFISKPYNFNTVHGTIAPSAGWLKLSVPEDIDASVDWASCDIITGETLFYADHWLFGLLEHRDPIKGSATDLYFKDIRQQCAALADRVE